MRTKSEQGQATALTVVLLTVLLGMTALVLDVGSWYRAKRAAQSTADAAALAGAQALPSDPAGADSLALQYAGKNGGGLSAGDITISSGELANDTIEVHIARTAPSSFANLFGIASVDVGATATARASLIGQAKYVAPIGVNVLHPKLKGTSSCPCFGTGNPTTLPLDKTGAPGAFDLLNVDQSHGGTGPATVADWIQNGFSGYLPVGAYLSDPGAKWNSSPIEDALQARMNTTLLFPVYDTLTGTGANAQYHVVGWVGFHLTGFTASGQGGSVSGYFTEVVWDGIESTSSAGNPNLGARVINLID